MLDTLAVAQAVSSLSEKRNKLGQELAVLEYQQKVLQESCEALEKRNSSLLKKGELLKQVGLVLQDLVRLVSTQNLLRIEHLVNEALKDIFHDLDLQFKLVSEVKRDVNQYRISITNAGVGGTVDSIGGGVLSVVACVLKIMFNRFTRKYPLVVFDESLSFLSERYIARARSFLKAMSVEFGMPILMVTHQNQLAESADSVYRAAAMAGGGTCFIRD
jgi:chromosome segregation ATPase